MIGWTVEKNKASGMRVTASKLRLVMVQVSETAHRARTTTLFEWGAPDRVGGAMAVVMRALRLRWALLL